MTPKDIKVGCFYEAEDSVFFGVGMRKLYTHDEFVEKHLINIETGLMMQEGDNARDGLWKQEIILLESVRTMEEAFKFLKNLPVTVICKPS